MPEPNPAGRNRRSRDHSTWADAFQGVRRFDHAKTVLLVVALVGILLVGVVLLIQGLRS